MTKHIDQQILAILEIYAAHWEYRANVGPLEESAVCLDYAKHIRTIIECKRMDMMESAVR